MASAGFLRGKVLKRVKMPQEVGDRRYGGNEPFVRSPDD